jgi:hypothetical protein
VADVDPGGIEMRVAPLVVATAALVGLAGCHPAPSVGASPRTGLVDGQEVVVSGGGYAANATIGVVQCPAGADSIDDCDGRTARTLSTDADGHFRTTVTVHRVLNDGHDVDLDCAEAPGRCEIVSVYVHGFAEPATAPLAFAG